MTSMSPPPPPSPASPSQQKGTQSAPPQPSDNVDNVGVTTVTTGTANRIGSSNQNIGSLNQKLGSTNQNQVSVNQKPESGNPTLGAVNQSHGTANQNRGSANQNQVSMNQNQGPVNQTHGSTSQNDLSVNQNQGSVNPVQKVYGRESVPLKHHLARGVRSLTQGRLGRTLVIALPYAWLFLFLLLPILIVVKISLAESALASPPYTPMLEWLESRTLVVRIHLSNYAFLWQDPLYLAAYLNSLKVAAVSTLLCLLIGYPMAYGIARAPQGWRIVLLMLVILPFWTSFLIRVYAWIGLLQSNGLINHLLLSLGLIDQPLALLHSNFAVYLGIVYSYLPFMVLPLYASLVRLDHTLLEAAADLGCRPWKAFLTVTLPLSMPGVIAGSLLVFIPAVGEFVIPDLLGGPDSLMIGKLLWTEFFSNRDWPVASAVAVAMVVLILIPLLLLQRIAERQTRGGEAS